MHSGYDIPVSEQIANLGVTSPHSVALTAGDQRLTFAELNRQADQFAAYLAGLVPVFGGTVAICMERSFDWIVAALGAMRAGAAYLPLDPAWPDARLRFAVNDSHSIFLVARTPLICRLGLKIEGVDPGRDAKAIAAVRPDREFRGPVGLENLAYVIYTSGSAGVPKGVEITHANLCHLIRWHRETFAVTPKDRAGHVAGLGFDAAVWEIWPHLAAGTTVCLADEAVRFSPDLLQRWLIHDRVTIAFFPTVLASSLMAMPWPATSSLRILLTGGDVLQQGPTTDLPFTVVNNYGPTECTVVSTSVALKPESVGKPPIGRPIRGANIYLLDEGGRPVPDGDRGEIYIGGGGVGRGYRNLPDSTAQCFMPDPFVGGPNARMYRTGDLGLRRPDGEIEFCGRRDRQVKIRGIRIELDEIGNALMSHPAVDFAVAVARTSEEEANELVAYVIPRKNAAAPTTRELRQHLLERLPNCMTPSKFVRLDEMPLSANAKIDLRGLTAPTPENMLADDVIVPGAVSYRALAGNNEAASESENVARANPACDHSPHSIFEVSHPIGSCMPTRVLRSDGNEKRDSQSTSATGGSVSETAKMSANTVEEKLLTIMRLVLRNNSICASDNFLLAGGHSLLAMQVLLRMREAFGVDIALHELFTAPSVARLAAVVEKNLIRNISSMTEEEAERQLAE
jgi:amino acid adenylation domain-containing protein